MNEALFAEHGIWYRTNTFQKGRETLVFIHGLSGSSSAWRRYEEYFNEQFNILSFDLRGHGKSIRPKRFNDYKIESFAEDLKALTEFLKIDTCTIIGHSFGAAVALEFILTYPERVKAAVFMSPDFHVKEIPFARIVFPVISWIVCTSRILPIFRHHGGHIDYSKYEKTGDWNIRRMAADISNTGLHVYFYCLKQAYDYDRETRLKDIHVPLLIIHGGEDSVVPSSYSVNLAAKIAHSQLEVLPHDDHILVFNDFLRVSEVIGKFISHAA